MANAQEIAFWNEVAGSRWVRFQERIDRAFAPLAARGLAALDATSGERILDIGCGCGTSSLELARARTHTITSVFCSPMRRSRRSKSARTTRSSRASA